MESQKQNNLGPEEIAALRLPKTYYRHKNATLVSKSHKRTWFLLEHKS